MSVFECCRRSLHRARTDLSLSQSSFCRYIKPEELQPLSLRIIGDLGPYLAEATEETLALVLETIRAVIGVDGSILDESSTQQLVNAILQVWGTNARGEYDSIGRERYNLTSSRLQIPF